MQPEVHVPGPVVHEPGSHAHPSARTYILVAVILTLITAVEVAIYYVPAIRAILPLLAGGLVVLAVSKFVLVVGFYMHLKFDNKLFTWLFVGGLLAAIATLTGLWALQPTVHGGPGLGG
jgi:cytochrome c oxidase subunit IV